MSVQDRAPGLAGRAAGHIPIDQYGVGYVGAQRFQIAGQQTVRARLDQHIADSGGFDGACDDRDPDPVGDELAQQPVLGAPADDVHRLRRGAREQRRSLDTVGEGGGEALDDGPAPFRPPCVGAVRPRVAIPRGDAAWHVPGGLEGGIVGVEHLARRWARGGLLEKLGEVDAGAAALPVPDRFTQQPEAHDVAQEADSPVGADLVGEVGRPGRLGHHRSVQFDADESPGATRDVDRGLRCHGYGHHRRGGVVRGDRADVRLTSQTEPRCEVRQNWAQIGAWVNDAGKQSGGDAEQSPSTRHPIGRRCRASPVVEPLVRSVTAVPVSQ